MTNKKGSGWLPLIWITLLTLIFASTLTHSNLHNLKYDYMSRKLTNTQYDNQNNELQRTQEDYYYQQMEEELQREYEQKQNEEMLREQQRKAFKENVRYQKQYEEQDKTNTQKLSVKCTDSDGGKNYYTKGYIIHSDGTKEYDKCDTWNQGYENYVIEYYCTSNGRSRQINYHCPYGCSDGACNLKPQKTTAKVSYVLDGDTIQLSSGETVRLAGINAPEIGQPCSSEATDKLRQFVLDKEVTLEQDINNKDQYGRLLRYIYIDDILVNLEMVRLGLAHKYEYGSNTKYSTLFEQAENEAKQNKRCLWKSEEANYIKDKCIYVANFHYNAAGNDNYNLNDEYVTLGNRCSYSINITGWTVKDETASHIYTIPSLILESHKTFTLYTGTGKNTNSELYWGKTPGNYAAIWNNDGDTLFLRDSYGNLVLTQSY